MVPKLRRPPFCTDTPHDNCTHTTYVIPSVKSSSMCLESNACNGRLGRHRPDSSSRDSVETLDRESERKTLLTARWGLAGRQPAGRKEERGGLRRSELGMRWCHGHDSLSSLKPPRVGGTCTAINRTLGFFLLLQGSLQVLRRVVSCRVTDDHPILVERGSGV